MKNDGYQGVHGGVSMTLASFGMFPSFIFFLSGVNSLCPTRVDKIEVFLKMKL